ncbi:hypothetical protein ED208_15265 [Stagnimonas aquatica]|uniref:Uncharacterized protein n=1 Tax=Stagnimonas aquatica TaxID=2689987 RepID=A0A3N0V1Y6_9GAMM|nr:hypothetical protein [Stagnimonas aquatica]ROH86790.1 hypothetical protein ED208_15265 [Stagnimonas aquatica]
MSFAVAPARPLTAEEIQRYRDDGVVMVKGAIGASWLRLIESRIEKARSDMRMPVHFRHESRVGGELRAAAPPRILPRPIKAEREARRRPGAPSRLQLLGSGWTNLRAAAQLKLRAKPLALQQTWSAQAPAPSDSPSSL